MALPCIDNSCNIEASINDETRHLILKALVSANGGLSECTVDGGLAINVLDNAADGIGGYGAGAPVDVAFMDMGTTPGQANSSELWAALKGAQRHPFGGGAGFDDNIGAPIPHDGTESLKANIQTNPISDNSATNPFAAPSLALVMGTYRLGFSLDENNVYSGLVGNEAYRAGGVNAPGAIAYIPYHAKIRAQVYAVIGAEPTDWVVATNSHTTNKQSTAFFEIGGMARNDKAPQHLRDWRDFMFAILVPAGEQIHLAASAVHDGDHTIRTFVDTETPPGINGEMEFLDRGIKCSGEVIFLPLNASVVN